MMAAASPVTTKIPAPIMVPTMTAMLCIDVRFRSRSLSVITHRYRSATFSDVEFRSPDNDYGDRPPRTGMNAKRALSVVAVLFVAAALVHYVLFGRLPFGKPQLLEE
ncbi:hypothetical protein GCM10009019_19390 [Salarchaeum japonicum]|uniref:Transmembrane protein n=1 Tax=Salarchaeum japonicum TaxID=555573 RepID=A0AAV3T358_9EURY